MSQRVPARRVARVAAAALRDRGARRRAAAVAALYLPVYLVAVGDLVVWTGTDSSRFVHAPSVEVAADWPAKLLAQRAPFAYEPVLAIHPVNHVTVFVAPADLAMGLLLVVGGYLFPVALLAAALPLVWNAHRLARATSAAAPGSALR